LRHVPQINPEFPSRPERSCDASSQKGAGDALVASCGSDYPAAGKKCDGGVAITLWRRGVAATFGWPLQSSG